MIVRLATEGDLEAIVAIHNQSVDAGAIAYTEQFVPRDRLEWLRSHMGKRPMLVAESDGRLCGWACLGNYRSGRQALRHTAELTYHVDVHHRRGGIATALVEALIERCPDLEVRTLVAVLLASNRASIGFLESMGFQNWARLPAVAELDGTRVDHLYYGRHL